MKGKNLDPTAANMVLYRFQQMHISPSLHFGPRLFATEAALIANQRRASKKRQGYHREYTEHPATICRPATIVQMRGTVWQAKGI